MITEKDLELAKNKDNSAFFMTANAFWRKLQGIDSYEQLKKADVEEMGYYHKIPIYCDNDIKNDYEVRAKEDDKWVKIN